MNIKIDLFKPSGKWYMDLEVVIPKDLRRFELDDFLSSKVLQQEEFGWIVCVHPDRQKTKEVADFISFPELIKEEVREASVSK